MVKHPKSHETRAFTITQTNVIEAHVGVFINKEFYERVGRGYRPLNSTSDKRTVYKTHRDASRALRDVKTFKGYYWSRFGDEAIREVNIIARDLGGISEEYLAHNSAGALVCRRSVLDKHDLFKTRARAVRAATASLKEELADQRKRVKNTLAKIQRLEKGE